MALRLKILLSSLSSMSVRQPLCSTIAVASSPQRRNLSTTPYEEFNVQSTEDFNERVLKSKLPTVVDFHADWCKPCKLLAPLLKEVLGERPGRVQLAKVDVDKHGDLAMEYDVSQVPKVVMIKDGKFAGQFVGLVEKDKLESFIDRLTL